MSFDQRIISYEFLRNGQVDPNTNNGDYLVQDGIEIREDFGGGLPIIEIDIGGHEIRFGFASGTVDETGSGITGINLDDLRLHLFDRLGNIPPITAVSLAEDNIAHPEFTAADVSFTRNDIFVEFDGPPGPAVNSVELFIGEFFRLVVDFARDEPVIALGGNGRDTLVGGDNDDVLSGGNGRDVLDGLAGDDLLTGGHGPDRFIIRAGSGQDTIADFAAPDVVVLPAGNAALDSFAEVSARITDTPDGALLDLGGGNTVLFAGFAKAGFARNDFAFTA